MALLTIIIPTFNRAGNLAFLLDALKRECEPLAGRVSVLVSDNASTDATAEVIDHLKDGWPALIVHRHKENVGAEENFCSAIDSVRTRYFWIIGDDDCPRSGLIEQLVRLLEETSPALVYMQSEWVHSITHALQESKLEELHVEHLEPVEFCRRVNVWFTFISANVVDRLLMLTVLGEGNIRRLSGTSLVQLGWIYPLVKSGGSLAFVSNECVLATKENTGHYALLTAFGVNFPRITKDAFGTAAREGRVIVSRLIGGYLPALIVAARRAPAGRFLPEDPWVGMRRLLGGRLAFWLLLLPLGKLPMAFARPYLLAWRCWQWLMRKAGRGVSGILSWSLKRDSVRSSAPGTLNEKRGERQK